ncbi:twitching motility protein PilT [Limnochorda pilosa]|uniref:Ribonuclease VapC n=2 Tax=Limnochorda pilosa TaxID=1555112 RepID=A0A0K2SME6_LIMPI|nr:twitching motility protein PilT [Limnochorda pilosa]
MSPAGRILVDSSLWVEYYHPRGDEAVRTSIQEAIAQDRVATVSIIAAEVLRGARREKDLRAITSDFQAFDVLPLTMETGFDAGRVLADLDTRGQRVPTVDAMIAVAAARSGCELWHLSDGHYGVLAEAIPRVLRGTRLPQRSFARSPKASPSTKQETS